MDVQLCGIIPSAVDIQLCGIYNIYIGPIYYFQTILYFQKARIRSSIAILHPPLPKTIDDIVWRTCV
jgi:hypothetical protein